MATSVDRKVRLDWTASGYGDEHFLLQRTNTLANWMTIDTIGRIAFKDRYVIRDEHPLPLGYYRLSDGQGNYSQVVRVRMDDAEDIIVYPNPVVNEVNIRPPGDLVGVRMMNTSGMVMMCVIREKGCDRWRVDIRSLARGVYVLELSKRDRKVYRRMVVE